MATSACFSARQRFEHGPRGGLLHRTHITAMWARHQGAVAMSKSGRVVYFNGQFVPETEARVSIYDSALMFGDMVFEMTRSFNGKQFMLREHLERLYYGLK